MKHHKTLVLLGILCAAIVLRVGVALYLGNVVNAPPLVVDQNSYHTLAVRLLTGHGFSFPAGWYPFTPPNTPTAHWSFLYPLWLALVYGIAGVQPLAARLAQAMLGGILLPLLIYRLARRLFTAPASTPIFERWTQADSWRRDGTPLLAAAIAAVYLYFVLYAAMLMTETFYIIVIVWSLEWSIALAERPTLRHGCALGIGLGLATLLRQSLLPWAAVLVVWLLWVGWRTGRLRRMVRVSGVALGLLALTILPFTLRNYAVYGSFLLLNSNAGYAMYSAQHPMHGTDFREFEAAPLPPDLQGRTEAEWDKDLMGRGVGFVLADPSRYVLLSISRIPDYFEFWPTPDTTLINNVGRVGSFGLFLPFMLYGVWLALRRGGRAAQGGWAQFSITPLALLVLFMAFYSLLHILTWAMPRYRLPVDAVAVPFAALAIADLVQRLRHAPATLRN